MIWTEKYWLWGLWLLPILAWLFRRAAVGARRGRALFAEPEMAERLAPARSGAREALRAALITAGMAFLLVAAAGPRGAGELVRVERKGADVQILLDISRSMLSDDVKPSRLENAKLDINDLLEKTGGDRVGLIAFAGRPTVKIPLTSDSEFFRDVLRTLSVADAPRGGTAIGEAIRLALRSVDPESTRDRAILLITDGEDHESDPLEAADEAAAMGVKIYTVALGDAEEGGRIPIYDERGRQTGYQKYKGKEIRTKADRNLLRQIAEKTGGVFLDMGKTPTDLGTFYRKSVDLKRSGYGEEDRRVWKEKFQPFLLVGLVLLISGHGISPWRAERKTAAAFLLAALTLVLPSGIARAEQSAGDDIDFFAEQPEESIRETEPAAPEEEIDPNLTAEELYNTACSLIEQGETARAILCLQRGIEETRPREKPLRGKLRYNLGILQAGQLEKEAEKIFREEDRETDTNSPVSAAPAAGPETDTPRDTVAEYRRGAAKRNAALGTLREKAARAAATLLDAAGDGDKKLREDALRSGDLILSWSEGKARAFDLMEREKRAELFEPADQLRWLDEELTRLSEADVLSKKPRRAAEWQRLYELAESLADRKADLEDLLEKGTFRDDENPEISAARLEAAERGLAALDVAAETFGAGEDSALDALREGIGQLDLAALSYADYQTVLFDAVARQEETVKRLAAPAQAGQAREDTGSETLSVTQEGTAARDRAILRRLDRMISDAREEFAQRPYTEEEENRAEPQVGTVPPDSEETQEGAEESLFAGGTDVETVPQAEPPEGISPEERIRRSMNLALELAPEVTREEDALAALTAETFRTEAPAHEEAVLELLRRIAEPLQDPNRQSQDQQNQDQQGQPSDQNQNQNGQDQGQQGEQNPQDQQGDQDQNSREDPRNENQEGENRQDQSDQDGQEQNQDQQTEGDQEDRGGMTPEEEEARRQEEKAEAMMRKVGQRQRQVEALRRQRERLFHRYEKPEKDW